MFTKREIINIICDNEAGIKQFGVKKIGVFGSFARAEAGSKSDIDILVEFKKGLKTFDNYMGLKFSLQKLLNHKIDLVIKEALKPAIKPHIIREVKYARL